LRRIDEKLDLYLQHPGMGRARDELADGLRSFPVGNYVVFIGLSPTELNWFAYCTELAI
jgi:plasmid stabilization system protein ParE